MGLQTRTGRLSDLAEAGQRADWSSLTEKLRGIEPGAVLIVTCPGVMEIGTFRSIVITKGKRLHPGGSWRFSTRTRGRDLYCFLAPRSS